MSRAAELRGLLVVAGVIPWAGALFVRWLPPTISTGIVLAMAPLCHHRPERTLILAGEPMAVCSRCAGLYAGIAVGALLAGLPLSTRMRRRGLLVALAAMVIDVVTQDLGLHPAWHVSRLATGALVGAFAAAWMTREIAASDGGASA